LGKLDVGRRIQNFEAFTIGLERKQIQIWKRSQNIYSAGYALVKNFGVNLANRLLESGYFKKDPKAKFIVLELREKHFTDLEKYLEP
jgi:hypothetical protein